MGSSPEFPRVAVAPQSADRRSPARTPQNGNLAPADRSRPLTTIRALKKFLARIDKNVPAGLGVHLVWDNLATHKARSSRPGSQATPGSACN